MKNLKVRFLSNLILLRNSAIPLGLVLSAALIAPPAMAEQNSVSVTTETLQALQYQPSRSVPATAIALNEAKLSAQLSARIDNIKINVGDEVNRGDTLVELDCKAYRLNRDDSGARLALAKSEASRAESLRQSSNIAEKNFNQAQTELKRAEVTHQISKLQTSHCRLKAPFNGIVTQRLAAKGELASPGTPLLTLLSHNDVELEAQLTPQQLTQLKTASDIRFLINEQYFDVSIRTSLPVVNPTTGKQMVRLIFNTDNALPGMTGRIEWQSAKQYLPAAYLLKRQDKAGYFIVDHGKAKFIHIDDNDVSQPFSSDLDSQTQLINVGRHGLQDGDNIEVQE